MLGRYSSGTAGCVATLSRLNVGAPIVPPSRARTGEHWARLSVKPTMTNSLLLLAAALALAAAGCHQPRAGANAPTPAAAKPAALTGAEVLAVARQAVATNDTWLDRAEFEGPRPQADGSWSVLVWRLPKTPGGHRVIRINEQGQVTRYVRGA
jgi:hypothetical protein